MSKKDNINIYRKGIVVLLIVILLFALEKMKSGHETYIAQKGVIENKTSARAVIIRKEKVYFSNSSGEVKFFFDKGDKVSAGTLIAEQYIDEDAKETGESIEAINQMITLKSINQGYAKNTIENNYEKIENDLQIMAYKNNGSEVSEYIKETNSENYAYRNYERYTYEDLKKMKADLERSLKERKKSYYSEIS